MTLEQGRDSLRGDFLRGVTSDLTKYIVCVLFHDLTDHQNMERFIL